MNDDFKESRVLFYCLGSGMGHLARAATISRKLKRLIRGDIAIITNSPFHYLLEVEDITCVYLKNLVEIDDDTGNLIRNIIGQINPELFIIDTYPTGIKGELIPLLKNRGFKKALLRRNIPETVISLEAMASYAQSYFDLVINYEPIPPLDHPVEVDCCPILIRDSDELLTRQLARDVLLSKNSQKILLGVTTGSKEDSLSFFKLVEKVFFELRQEQFGLRFASPHNFTDFGGSWYNIKYFPLFELFLGVDILVGYYGHSLFYESKALSIPTIFVMKDDSPMPPLPLGENQIVSRDTPEELEKNLRELMQKEFPVVDKAADFANQSQKAAAYLTQLLFSTGDLKGKEYKDRIQWFLL